MGEKWPVNLACDSDFHVNRRVLLHAVNLRHWKEGMLWIFFFARKIRLLRPGSNPRSLGTRGQRWQVRAWSETSVRNFRNLKEFTVRQNVNRTNGDLSRPDRVHYDVKGKYVSFHTVKAYGGSGIIAPPILRLDAART
jgi:hypothetical protein